jgi:hypothetical protein
MKVTDTSKRRKVAAGPGDPEIRGPQRLVERIFAQPAAEGQALRRQWMEDLQLPVATIEDIVNAGGKLPKS